MNMNTDLFGVYCKKWWKIQIKFYASQNSSASKEVIISIINAPIPTPHENNNKHIIQSKYIFIWFQAK